ncbi:ABC transporter substrate-binding protein [Georgenia daeguensis]|uniref:ABC transporter substrate-binding protein n=1 Tax=Georgenia daeguensis TaxID=908355 RepID=A0ABP8EV65_9MICO
MTTSRDLVQHRSRTPRRSAAGTAVAALAAVALTACSAGGAGEAGTTGGSSDAALRIVMANPPKEGTLDTCDGDNNQLLQENITEPLVRANGETGELEPLLAVEWTEESATRWLFTLREGVTFHDGQPFDAEAAAWWLNRVLDPATDCYVLESVLTSDITSVSAVDEHTLAIDLGSPDPILPRRLAFTPIGAPTDDPLAEVTDPVGTGPYQFVNYTPDQSFTMERYADYWGEAPDVEEVEYIFRSESAVRAAMASTGEVDLAMSITAQDADAPNAQTYTISETLYARLDSEVPPFDDARVRKAVNLAIDRQTFIDNVFGGKGEPASEIFLPNVVGYNPDVTWEYDPDEARRLIAEAKADGVDVDREIEILGRAGLRNSNGSETMDTLAAMLGEVGLKARTVVMEFEQYRDRFEAPQDPAALPMMIVNVHGNSLGDAHLSLAGKLGCGAPQSPVCDETFQQMLDAAGAASGDERESLLQDAARYAHDEMTFLVPVAYTTDTLITANECVQYTPNPATFQKLAVAEIKLDC